MPYNPDIASVFFRAALLESWGRGIDLIRDACLAHGSPSPDFRWDNGLWVDLPFMAVETASEGTTTQETTQETRETTQETQETTQERILALLGAEPSLTRRALAERIGITANGIKYHLEKLKETGVIRHVGSTKAGHWEVLE